MGKKIVFTGKDDKVLEVYLQDNGTLGVDVGVSQDQQTRSMIQLEKDDVGELIKAIQEMYEKMNVKGVV